MKALIGTGTALITPFNGDHSIDFDALSRIIEQQIAGGTNYFVMLGTTGESATLSNQEKNAVVSHIKSKRRTIAPCTWYWREQYG